MAALGDAESRTLDARLEKREKPVKAQLGDGGEVALSRVMFRVNEMAEKKVPTMVEPSFGVMRIL